jgi:hypothetical protein
MTADTDRIFLLAHDRGHFVVHELTRLAAFDGAPQHHANLRSPVSVKDLQ